MSETETDPTAADVANDFNKRWYDVLPPTTHIDGEETTDD